MSGKGSKVRQKVCDELEIANEIIDAGDVLEGEIVEAIESDLIVHNDDRVDDLLADYKETRETLRKLIEKADKALDGILTLASESESARTYEVAGNLVKIISDVSDKLLTMHKHMKDITKEGGEGSGGGGKQVTNNNVFLTPDQLDRMIEGKDKDE